MRMPAHHTGASAGARKAVLWTFVLAATIGFAVIAAGLAGWRPEFIPWGFAGTAFAFVLFLAYQAAAPSGPRPVAGRPKGEPPMADLAERAVSRESGDNEEGLVEFTLESADPPRPARPEGAWPQATEAQFRRQRSQRLPPGEFEVPAAFKKREQFTADLPIVRSIFTDEDDEEERTGPVEVDGKTRGQCGECKTYLWAPKRRPIRLRCPKCGKVALLKA